jgi:hypothetical protein
MRKLDARDCHRCGLDGFEPEHRRTSSLDRPVILLDDVVKVRAGSEHVRAATQDALAEAA